MPQRVIPASPLASCTGARRQKCRARAAARPARPTGGSGPERGPGSAARAARGRSRLARRRAGARLSARAVRSAGPGGGAGFRRGAARPADGRRRPRGLDRPEERAVRTGVGGAGPHAGAADRGPGATGRGASLGARGSLAQFRSGRRARRGRAAEPHPEPAAAARRRGPRGDRIAVATAGRRRHAERCRNVLADRSSAQRGGRRTMASGRLPALAGRPAPLSWWSHRQLADRLARGWLA